MITQDWDPLVTRKEAACLLGVSVATLDIWASTGRYDLPFVKVGRLAKYRLSDLRAFVDARRRCLEDGS